MAERLVVLYCVVLHCILFCPIHLFPVNPVYSNSFHVFVLSVELIS